LNFDEEKTVEHSTGIFKVIPVGMAAVGLRIVNRKQRCQPAPQAGQAG